MHLLGVLLMGGTLMMTSCTKDEDIIPDPTLPTIGFFAGSGLITDDVTIEQGTSFKVNIRASKGSGDMVELRILEDNAPVSPSRLKIDDVTVSANPVAIPSFDQSALNWVIEVQATDHVSAHTYKFEVVGSDGPAASVSLTVTTFDPGTPVTTHMGVIWNADGPNQGGFDLKAMQSVSSSSTQADIRDRGIDLGQPTATNWRQQIEPRNGAILRKAAAGANFNDTATKEQILAAFNAAGADLTMSPKIAEGDIFLIKKDDLYAMVRFTKVNVTTNNNLDNYEVDIKK